MEAQTAEEQNSIERGSNGSQFTSADAHHIVTITDPADFSDAVEAAETLGMSLSGCENKGIWWTHKDAGFAVSRGMEFEVVKAGRKWFHVKFDDGNECRMRPVESDRERAENGKLRLLFD
jgi:hypothetical protein